MLLTINYLLIDVKQIIYLSTLFAAEPEVMTTQAKSDYGNDYLPWLYTQPLQNIGGGANVCIVLGK